MAQWSKAFVLKLNYNYSQSFNEEFSVLICHVSVESEIFS